MTADAVLPPFLRALGLDADADAGAIRRAYARQLKQIDPAQDPQAFQDLREAYEAAQYWDRQRPREEPAATTEPAVVADVLASPPAVPIEAPPDPIVVGEEVFASFAAAMADCENEAKAQQALDQALADTRLLHFDTRHYFEWRVGRALMEGWRPGHEFLFGVACKTFAWEEDRRRLQGFGQLGWQLDAAITEKLMFYRQLPAQFQMQRALIRRLRVDEAPDKQWLALNLKNLLGLAQLHPHWMHVIAPMARLQEWERLAAELLPARTLKAMAGETVLPPRKESKLSGLRPYIGLIAVLVFGLFQLIASESRRTPVPLNLQPSSTSRFVPAPTPPDWLAQPGTTSIVAPPSGAVSNWVPTTSPAPAVVKGQQAAPRPTSPQEARRQLEAAEAGVREALAQATQFTVPAQPAPAAVPVPAAESEPAPSTAAALTPADAHSERARSRATEARLHRESRDLLSDVRDDAEARAQLMTRQPGRKPASLEPNVPKVVLPFADPSSRPDGSR